MYELWHSYFLLLCETVILWEQLDNDIDVSMSDFTSKESRLKYRKFQPVQKTM